MLSAYKSKAFVHP